MRYAQIVLGPAGSGKVSKSLLVQDPKCNPTLIYSLHIVLKCRDMLLIAKELLIL